jgi:hypothetical protein
MSAARPRGLAIFQVFLEVCYLLLTELTVANLLVPLQIVTVL